MERGREILQLHTERVGKMLGYVANQTYRIYTHETWYYSRSEGGVYLIKKHHYRPTPILSVHVTMNSRYFVCGLIHTYSPGTRIRVGCWVRDGSCPIETSWRHFWCFAAGFCVIPPWTFTSMAWTRGLTYTERDSLWPLIGCSSQARHGELVTALSRLLPVSLLDSWTLLDRKKLPYVVRASLVHRLSVQMTHKITMFMNVF